MCSTGQGNSASKVTSRKIWRYAYGAFDGACELLDSTDWNSLFSSGDINACWSIWKEEIMQLCIPQSTVWIRRNLPLINKQVVQTIRKRDARFGKTKKCKSPALLEKYRAARTGLLLLFVWTRQNFFSHGEPQILRTFASQSSSYPNKTAVYQLLFIMI